MVNSQAEIMLSILAKDGASTIFGNVNKNAQSMAGTISSCINNLNSSMMSLGQVSDNVMQGLTGKSAMDNILGTSSKAETNKVLVKNMLDDSEKHFESFYDNVDKVTDSSLTSMQELMPALKAFKSATGATDKEVQDVTDEIANFGAAVLAQTGSTDLAQQSMMDLSKGIKGAFASLDQYGITQAALERTGYWNGDEKDVEGFMKAVQEVTGSTEDLMETNQGLDALIGKAFSRAGKKMGNEFLPVLKDIKRGYLDLDDSLGGGLSATILGVSAGVETMNSAFWNISTAVHGVRDLSSAFSDLTGMIRGAGKAAETTGDAINTISNMSDMGAGAGGVLGAGADIANKTSKTEKVVDSGASGLMLADLLKDNKNAQKDAGNLLKELKESKKIEDSLSDELDTIQTPKTNFQKVSGWFKGLFKGSDDLTDTMDDMKDVSKGLKKADTVSDGIKEAAEMGTTVSEVAPAMTAGAEGGAAASAGATGLATTFTSMITPLLALSAVIIIMIPIVATIAAEAMIFIKLLGEFMESLNFGKINLDGATKGIKSIATALAWVGAAMTAMTFTSIMTGLAVITSGALGITGPLKIAKDALMDAAKQLQEFSNVEISKDIPEKIKSISDALKSVSDAMMALTQLTITTGFSNFVAWAFKFHSTTDALKQAQTQITDAAGVLNNFKFDTINTGVMDKIKSVCDALASVGDAMGALRSIRDNSNWDATIGGLLEGIFGPGLDIQQALNSVKDDIIKASNALSQFTGIADIPDGVADKIKKVSDTLTSVNEAFGTLRSMRDNSNWDGWMDGVFQGVDIGTAIDTIKNDLITASQKLAQLSQLSDVNEDITTKIGNLGKALTKVSEVCTTLSSLPPMEGFDTNQISLAVTSIRTAITELGKISGMTLSEDVNSVLGSVNTALQSLKTTLSSASGFSSASTNIGTQIVNGVKSGLNGLNGTVSSAVSSATSNAIGAATTGGRSLGTTMTDGFKYSLKLSDVMTSEMNYVKSAVDNGISAAKSAAQNGAEEVVEAFKNGINVGSPGDIARTMTGEMGYTLQAIKDSYYNLKNASYNAARTIVDSFGNPSLSYNSFLEPSSFNMSNLSGLETTTSPLQAQTNNQGNITIIVNEGAVQVDARNKTTQEARQIMITALESLDTIEDIQVA